MEWDWENGVSREDCADMPGRRGLPICVCVSAKQAHAGLKWMDEIGKAFDTRADE